ncbi:acetate--CoA ligase [Legionella quateirensis]|uniref:Acetate--CoA ligase n=1 Tax=Legionella quateirensis TaxID=45072 RepID=A0A378KS96_9GAMM|nr:acetate--CoA ligase [Legionella quateirensis]KTD52913.1 acetyl-coenzyme A synthetase [Legionella quateirensis]STY16357.1 acetyl-CoA synthetase [Legionella quateirensis]
MNPVHISHPKLSNTLESLTEFWSEIASQTLDWIRPWDTVLEGGFKHGDVTWFNGGQLNVSANCLDRHLPQKANQPAIIWEGDIEQEHKTLTFAQLHDEVCRMSNVLKHLNVQKGDKVGIYLPMIPEAAIAMLACARIGAVHTVVFAGFSPHALRQRLIASECKCLITADSFKRGGKTVNLKEQADEASENLNLQTLIIKKDNSPVAFNAKTNHWWHELKQKVTAQCEPEPMNAEDPLFILYTSGSTGQPKGVVHTTGGYLLQAAYTHQLIFNCQNNEVFWCTADVGWITGHSYVVYGPLCNGITTLMYEGIPTWPNPARNWQIIDKYQVSVFYTAPTAIRSLMRAGDEWLKTSSRASLRLLGTVGEPINPEAWNWYHQKVGQGRCPVVDTWWQTETGAIMISPRSDDPIIKPGAASHPVPGIVPVLLDEQGLEIHEAGEGSLAIKYPWPSIARTIAGDHQRYRTTYLMNGYYITGDGAKRDKEGDYWITGRIDDVLNVSGHRLGTAEIESALVSHPSVAEAGVVGIPHDIKGQGIFAFVILKQGHVGDDQLKAALIEQVKDEISAIAKPDEIYFAVDLPKTRSGKIMRRILRKIAGHEVEDISELGDLSTLSNPHIVEELMKDLSELNKF